MCRFINISNNCFISNNCLSNIREVLTQTKKCETRWTFLRVKLVFECEFEIFWSLGPWDFGTPGHWDPWTFGLLDLSPPPTPPHTSPYILLPPSISSSYSAPLV